MCEESYGDARERVEKESMYQSRQDEIIDALVAALELTAGMYERASGLPMPSQAYRALALARGGK